MRSIEHRFDPFPTLEATMSTMTLGAMTLNATTRNATTPGRATTERRGAARPALRLTGRGRAVVAGAATALMVLVVVAVVLLGGGSAAAGDATSGGAAPARPLGQHVVMPGETLWQIAAQVDPSADPRDTVARIRELNRLESAELAVGTRLLVPPVG